MTQIRTELFNHIGGPADGCAMPVEVDANGVPVEFNVTSTLTDPDARINPLKRPQSNIVNATYERRAAVTENGVGFEFHFVAEAVDHTSGDLAA